MSSNPREKLVREWRNGGVENIEESIWSSSIQQSDLFRIRDFLRVNSFRYCDVSIVRPPDEKIERIKFKTHYDVSGQCFNTNYQISIPANSNNLKLTIGLESELKNQQCQDKTLYIINSLRILFGVPLARELMFTTLSDIDKFITAGFNSELGYASNFDTQHLNFFNGIEHS